MSKIARNFTVVYTLFGILTVIVFCFSLAACITVPPTERKSLNLIPDSEVLTWSDQQ
jgi:starvation-inducible outer membrane lipoprotein